MGEAAVGTRELKHLQPLKVWNVYSISVCMKIGYPRIGSSIILLHLFLLKLRCRVILKIVSSCLNEVVCLIMIVGAFAKLIALASCMKSVQVLQRKTSHIICP